MILTRLGPGMRRGDARATLLSRRMPGPSVVAISLVLILTASSAFSAQDAERPLVITALAPLYQLTLPLVAGTNVELQLVPDSARSMQAQMTLFTRQADRFTEVFARADAVIGAGKLWTADPLYTAVREVNIRVVPIDASKPWSHELDGVAVAESPATRTVSPYFWLSPSNVIRIIDIVAADLERLYPADAATIRANLDREKAAYVQLKSDTEARLLNVDDPFVYALADEFVYLTSDLGIFVEDYFVKQDIDWTSDDYATLTAALQAAGVKVVLHKWDPAVGIREAVEAAGATLVVLDTLETTADFSAGLRADLDALASALAE